LCCEAQDLNKVSFMSHAALHCKISYSSIPALAPSNEYRWQQQYPCMRQQPCWSFESGANSLPAAACSPHLAHPR
jgi:hypothetical protein